MPIPELNEHGLLPEGMYDGTLEEIGARFGRFQTTDRCVQSFAKLCDLVDEERRAGLAIALLIDGSFVSSKPDPGDIDLVIVLPDGYNFAAELPPMAYNAISKRCLRRVYQFDVFVVENHSVEYIERVAFFCQDSRQVNARKGILKAQL
ncbi:MAG TPA: hypothetical protein VFZ34_13425 [Blastocatellia bacterium]|nr:hypothetical protein [Blastocatellia bacterium]